MNKNHAADTIKPKPNLKRKRPQSKPRVLRLFISYSSEDWPIASAVAISLRAALTSPFAEINIDKWFLKAGNEFKKSIEEKLEETDRLVIIYTGTDKKSHGYTGWEVGYFEHAMKSDPQKKIVSIFLDKPPATTAEVQGIGLNISRELLKLKLEDFENINQLTQDDPLCRFIVELQDLTDTMRNEAGYDKAQKNEEQNPVECAARMRLEIFRYLRTTIETANKPQKQVTIKIASEIDPNDLDLPKDTKIIPTASGSTMDIFGLPDNEITWEQFIQSTSESKFSSSWREAIASVVISSLPDRINVDNSQLIFSTDESRMYRVILTEATKTFEGERAFGLFFVETWQRGDYGDQTTTLLLKGLELVCRFRFLFLEHHSEFSGNNILANGIDNLRSLAADLLKELNLLRKEARDAGLDQPHVWSRFVDWDPVLQMAEIYRPHEERIRTIISSIIDARNMKDQLAESQKMLAREVDELRAKIAPYNALLIHKMAEKLKSIADDVNPQASGDLTSP